MFTVLFLLYKFIVFHYFLIFELINQKVFFVPMEENKSYYFTYLLTTSLFCGLIR